MLAEKNTTLRKSNSSEELNAIPGFERTMRDLVIIRARYQEDLVRQFGQDTPPVPEIQQVVDEYQPKLQELYDLLFKLVTDYYGSEDENG